MATDPTPTPHPATMHEFIPGQRRFAVELPPMVPGGKKPYIFRLPYPSWPGAATRSPKAEPPQSPLIPDVQICAPTPTTSLSEVISHSESSSAQSPSRLQGPSHHRSPTRQESSPRLVSPYYDQEPARLHPPFHLVESVRHRTPLFEYGVVPPSTPSPSPATHSSPRSPTRCSSPDVRHVTPFPSTPRILTTLPDPPPLPFIPRHTTPLPFMPMNPAPVPPMPRDTTPLQSSPRHTTRLPSSLRHRTPLPFTPTNPTPLSSTPGHSTPPPFAPMNPMPVPSMPRDTTPLPHVARPNTLTVPSGLRSNLHVSTSPMNQRVSPYPASHPVASSSHVRLEDTAGSRLSSASFPASSFNDKQLTEMFRLNPIYFIAIPES
ncbi:hypothetical protein BDN71DRAFT_1512935 [Pleurotus eryngii]|uniref:Uncharacterized protein n=1 Tax=Pleurotus eryngii TaxID=5323 RepID=A0A9P5ZLL8_PLEER|nr:hypothetical protein BDN71DRAFT_1512935 [Pleurotus eryngii]